MGPNPICFQGTKMLASLEEQVQIYPPPPPPPFKTLEFSVTLVFELLKLGKIDFKALKSSSCWKMSVPYVDRLAIVLVLVI